ncbi:C-type lectin domain family 4 member C [Echinops telfairi]|uniref:C-type lectin domain family 4 member C n=1 Tax=Echinops telfairi TaxID=9371 RepID=A0ABM1VJZ4_ECHTE|nr:C-type lectin domain family 4 member C [Echinops telfairi]
MARGQPQEPREEEVWRYQVKVWSTAAVCLSVLSGCFIGSCWVVHDNYKMVKKLSEQQEPQNHSSHVHYVHEGEELQGTQLYCCPNFWSLFQSSCYFLSTELKTWTASERHCSALGAHLMVINTENEQQFILQKLDTAFAYYVGLSDPEEKHQWQWVDQSPYNESVTFWHPGEPNNHKECCVMLNSRNGNWGWNDVHCDVPQMSICEKLRINL